MHFHNYYCFVDMVGTSLVPRLLCVRESGKEAKLVHVACYKEPFFPRLNTVYSPAISKTHIGYVKDARIRPHGQQEFLCVPGPVRVH